MLLGGLEFIGIKYFGGKLLAAHAAHTAAAKVAFATHHPLSMAWQETVHHGFNSIMTNPNIHPAVKAALAQSVLRLAGATGTATAPAVTGSALHTAAHFAELAGTPVIMQRARETEAYQDLVRLLSDWREDWLDPILVSIRNQGA